MHNPPTQQTQAQPSQNPIPQPSMAVPPITGHTQNTTGNQSTTSQQNNPAQQLGFWKNPNHWIAIATVVISVANGLYTYFALNQWREMQISNSINREALISVQRAFITVKTPFTAFVGTNKTNARWQFQHQFENSGVTPTLEAVQYCTYLYQRNELPRGFTFPDGIDLKSGEKAVSPFDSMVIGPKQVMSPLPFYLPASLIAAIQSHDLKLYMWGWVRYRDQFAQSPVHVTEFCYEVDSIIGDVSTRGAPVQWSYRYCPEHNCVDQKCKDYTAIVDR